MEEGQTQEDLGSLLAAGARRRFVFVGGKGGVGKTTTASALAVRLAKHGRKTLVVSTDPAHSLGDALSLTLTGEPQEVPLEAGAGGEGLLFAMEIDPLKVVEEFREALSLDRVKKALSEQKGGIGAGLLAALAQAGVDVESLVSMLDMSPPGIDEAVALARLMQLLSDKQHEDFERVIIDTAPTGHTLRLLAFPQFLHGLVGTLLSVSEKVSGLSLVPASLFGQLVGDDFRQQLRNTKATLERFMASMSSLTKVFEDRDTTSFVVVSIPTQLAVTESKRLLQALEQAHMPARHIVINQCPFVKERQGEGHQDHSLEIAAATAKLGGIAGRKEGAALGLSEVELNALLRAMSTLSRQHTDARRHADALAIHAGSEVSVYCVPVFEEEPTGSKALHRYADALKRRQQ